MDIKALLLIYNYLHRSEDALDAVGTHRFHARDVEALAAREATETILLALGECGTVAHFGDGVAHRVEEHGLETQHFVGYVEQVVVDGGFDAGSGKEERLGKRSSAAIAVFVSFAIIVSSPFLKFLSVKPSKVRVKCKSHARVKCSNGAMPYT